MSDYCCRPESKYTTHSGPGSAFGSPDRRARWMGMIALLREVAGEYGGTPFRVATYTAIALQLAGTRNPGTRTLLQALSTGSSLDSPPSKNSKLFLKSFPRHLCLLPRLR